MEEGGPEDPEELVNLRVAPEEWLFAGHFGEDAAWRSCGGGRVSTVVVNNYNNFNNFNNNPNKNNYNNNHN